jgi:hypothetical protein
MILGITDFGKTPAGKPTTRQQIANSVLQRLVLSENVIRILAKGARQVRATPWFNR